MRVCVYKKRVRVPRCIQREKRKYVIGVRILRCQCAARILHPKAITSTYYRKYRSSRNNQNSASLWKRSGYWTGTKNNKNRDEMRDTFEASNTFSVRKRANFSYIFKIMKDIMVITFNRLWSNNNAKIFVQILRKRYTSIKRTYVKARKIVPRDKSVSNILEERLSRINRFNIIK